ncbi:hypothetical protein F4V43_09490 [Paenibacillus spiritus]|uniref:Uncharacterized protein n=1 Tax=Paenibacillus spiritus TaxID=2496557 RepID=A0A5J5G9S9_9BACL|nr:MULTISPECIES: hypothetical protein [Paenibacillus]KAA9004856.1 hypothetical protein F4V43_09490 [Paenibacillus spiritus]
MKKECGGRRQGPKRLGALLLPVLMLAVLALLSACSGSSGPASTIARAVQGCPDAEVEYVDFVRLNGVFYSYTEDANRGTGILPGERLGSVNYRLSGQACSDYESVDGNASYLEEGTELYEHQGYASSFRILAKTPQGLRVYEASLNPKAETVGELMDIEGRVQAVTLKDGAVKLTAQEQEEFLADFLSLSYRPDQLRKARLADSVGMELTLKDGSGIRLLYWLRVKPAMHPGVYVTERMDRIVQNRLKEAGYLKTLPPLVGPAKE